MFDMVCVLNQEYFYRQVQFLACIVTDWLFSTKLDLVNNAQGAHETKRIMLILNNMPILVNFLQCKENDTGIPIQICRVSKIELERYTYNNMGHIKA